MRTMVITKSLSKTEMDYYRPSLREGNTHAGAVSLTVRFSFKIKMIGLDEVYLLTTSAWTIKPFDLEE